MPIGGQRGGFLLLLLLHLVIGDKVVVPEEGELAGGLHAGEVTREEGVVLGREAGAVPAPDVVRDRSLVGADLESQRADCLHDHLRESDTVETVGAQEQIKKFTADRLAAETKCNGRIIPQGRTGAGAEAGEGRRRLRRPWMRRLVARELGFGERIWGFWLGR